MSHLFTRMLFLVLVCGRLALPELYIGAASEQTCTL